MRYAFMTVFACGLGVGLETLPHFDTHRIHHSRDVRETDTNYGIIFSWFDRMFGTFTPPARGKTVDCGLDGHDAPKMQTTLGLLAMPFDECVAVSARSPPDSMERDRP